MNVLFLVGNGFDKNLGMKTSFDDFYKYYLNVMTNECETVVQKFKRDIKEKKHADWSDLEKALGEYSSRIDNEQEYEIIIRDVVNSLGDYLELEQKKCLIPEYKTSLLQDQFIHFAKYFTKSNKQKFLKYFIEKNDIEINIINFNYTNTIEKILPNSKPISLESFLFNGTRYERKIRGIYHIHGTVEDTMIMGVNDIEQITNEKLRTKKIEQLIVKPRMNVNAQTLRDSECSDLISKANIIVIFGMSIGATDKCWWEKINKKIITDANALVVIVNYDHNINPRTKHLDIGKYDLYREKLLSYGNQSLEVTNKVSERILVELNTEMFKFPVKVVSKELHNVT